jgi:hypothetical protein
MAGKAMRAAAAEEAAKMDVPVPALQAFAKIQRTAPVIPRPLQLRLNRTGELISPNELERQIRNWQRCSQCHDEGKLGNAIDRTLRFCPCAAGTELRYTDGENWPAKEIERVHADAKSLLVAACHATKHPFTADAFENSEVLDGIDQIDIHLPGKTFKIPGEDLRDAVARLGWQRRIIIHGGRETKHSKSGAIATQESQPSERQPITQADIDRVLARTGRKLPARVASSSKSSPLPQL